jgi:hypothetical protein
MSQLAASDGQPGNWEEPGFFLRRLETVRFQEEGWQERYDGRLSRTVLRGRGGEIPPRYSPLSVLLKYSKNCDIQIISAT